jgi:V/A-type H+/Na+-transporting ATPase subunit E
VALDDLLNAIKAEAAARMAEELDTARLEADGILAAARAGFERTRAETLSAREAELHAAAGARLAAAGREARSVILQARERLLDDVLTVALDRLADASRSDAYRSTLAARLDAALVYLGEAPGVIRCSPDLVEPLASLATAEADAGGELTVEADGAIRGGFRLSSHDGGLEIDETLEGRLEQLRPAITIELVRRIEPEPSP